MVMNLKNKVLLENGGAVSFEAAPLTVASYRHFMKDGGINSKEARKYYLLNHVNGVNDEGGKFAVTDTDVRGRHGYALNEICLALLVKEWAVEQINLAEALKSPEKEHYKNVIGNEGGYCPVVTDADYVPADFFTEETVVSLKKPLEIKRNDDVIEIKALRFKAKNYGDCEGAMTEVWPEPMEKLVSFIRNFAMPNTPIDGLGDDVFMIFEKILDNMLYQDLQRVEALAYRPFLDQAQILYDQ